MATIHNLLDLGVEVAACDFDELPVSPGWRAEASDPVALARLRESKVYNVVVPTTATQVVVEAIGDDALRRVLELVDDPLDQPLVVTPPDQRHLLIFAADGSALRCGEICSGVKAVPNFVVLSYRDLGAAHVEGERRTVLPSAIAIRLKVDHEARALIEADRKRIAEPIVCEAQSQVYHDPRDIDHMLFPAADDLRRLGFPNYEIESLLEKAFPNGLGHVERAVSGAFAICQAGTRDAAVSGAAWLLPAILARSHAGLLVGPSGSGKSTLLGALAIAGASGGAFFDHHFVEPVGVLILSGEAAEEVGPRLRVLAVDAGFDLTRLPIWAAACRRGEDISPFVGLAKRRLWNEFGCGLGLILLDGLQSIYRPTDEEDEAFAWATTQDLRELAGDYDVAVLLAHHTGKRADGPRGSQAWADAANFILQIDADRDGRTGHFRKRRLRLTKTRLGPPLDLGIFRIEDSSAGDFLRFGEPNSPAGPAPAHEERSRATKTKGAPTSAERLHDALRAGLEAGEAIETGGRACVPLDIAMRRYQGDRPQPSRLRNLKRNVLAAAEKIGARIVERDGQHFVEIPGGSA